MAAADTRNTLRRVEFNEAGEGIYLHLRNSGIKVLSALYGSDYFRRVELGITLGEMDVIENLLDQCTKKDDAKVKVDLDDLDSVPLEFVQDKLMDAFSLAANGRLYKEQVEFLKEEGRKQAAAAEAPPPSGPAVTSEISNEEPTGPDSDQESSTS